MPSLSDLKAAHPELCFKCGYFKIDAIHTGMVKHQLEPCDSLDSWQAPAITMLTAAKEADEKRIEELTASCDCTDTSVCDKCQLARRKVPILEAQLTAEREAHEATRELLGRAVKRMRVDADCAGPHHSIHQLIRDCEAALARQEARDKEPPNAQ